MVHKKQFSNTKRIAANKVIDLVSAGKLSGAKACIKNNFKPKTELNYFFNGWIQQLEGNHVSAIKLFEKALIENPLNEDTLLGLAASYLEIGDFERAEECAQHAVTINSNSSKNLVTLATIISRSAPTNKTVQKQAEQLFERAFDLYNSQEANTKLLVDILSGWGGTLLNLNEIYQSKKILETAINIDPYNVIANKNLVSVYANLNELDKAIICAKKAQMGGDPEMTVDTMYQEGMLELLRGNYIRGWRLHEARLNSNKYKYRDLLLKGSISFGELVETNTLLLFQEQGIGDLLQFSHYIPKVYEKCNTIDLVVLPNTFLPMKDGKPQSPKEFILANFGNLIRNVYVRGVDVIPNEYDSVTSLMSLGFWFKTTATNSLPIHEFTSTKQSTIRPGSVGLFWKGSAHHANDSLRSIPTYLINDIIDSNHDISFVSLQIDRDEDLNTPTNVQICKEQLNGLDETLAVLKQCKLVITVDSMIAHLAAGANIPTIIMHAYSPDWRWGFDRECMWYPSVINIRQTELGNWDTVIGAVKQELTLFKNQVD